MNYETLVLIVIGVMCLTALGITYMICASVKYVADRMRETMIYKTKMENK